MRVWATHKLWTNGRILSGTGYGAPSHLEGRLQPRLAAPPAGGQNQRPPKYDLAPEARKPISVGAWNSVKPWARYCFT